MKKQTLVHAACLLACAATSFAAQAQSGSPASAADTPEIIVTASRSEQVLQTAPVGATVITRAQIESAGVLDANEAIRKIGGMAARSDLNGGREMKLDLRGFGETADQNVVVLVDGIRISENEQAAARLSGISAHVIERIEVVRGGSSVMWGEGATAGVINIITRSDAKTGLSGQVGLGAQSYGGRDAVASLRIGYESMAFDLQANSNSGNGYRSANNQSHQDVFAMGARARFGSLSLRARVQSESAGARLPGSLTFNEFLQNPRQVQLLEMQSWVSLKDKRISAGLDYVFGSWTAVLDIAQKTKTAESFSATYGDYSRKTDATGRQYSPRLVYKKELGATALTANVGMDVHQWSYTNSNTYGGLTSDQTNRALFVMTDWLLPNQMRVVAGMRSEKVEKSALDIGATSANRLNNRLQAQELSINQTVSHGVDVYGRYAKSYRMANVDDYATNVPFQTLRPQISTDKELGVKWRQAAQTAVARYFLQNTVDEIAYDQVKGVNTNIDPTRRSGFELQIQHQLSTSVTLSGNAQLMQAVFDSGTNAGKNIPLVNEKTAMIRASYKIDTNQSIETAWRYLSPSYFNDDAANACGKKIPSNRLLDTQYRWRDKGVEVGVGVSNVLNSATYNYAYSCTSGSLYPEPGRTLRATLKYSF